MTNKNNPMKSLDNWKDDLFKRYSDSQSEVVKKKNLEVILIQRIKYCKGILQNKPSIPNL